MRPRRTPAYPSTADADAFSTDLSDFSPMPDTLDPDAPRPSSRAQGPLVVCLACGSAPGARSECPHDEVARFELAPAPVCAAAERLAHAAQEKRSLERSLRKLVSAEVSEGTAALEVTPPQPAAVIQLPPLSLVCPKCAQETTVGNALQSAQNTSRTTRRKFSEQQGFFGFVAPPAASPEAPAPEVTAPEVTETTLPASKRARRKKKPAVLDEP